MKIVTPRVSASGLWNHFTGRKKYTIECGNCKHTYRDKVPFTMSDRASSICPACRAQNVWSHSAFHRAYENTLAGDTCA